MTCYSATCTTPPRILCQRVPLPISIIYRICTALLIKIIYIFAHLEKMIPAYLTIVAIPCLLWSLYTFGFWNGILQGFLLTISMAWVYAIMLILCLLLISAMLWLLLLPTLSIAAKNNWQLPPTIQHHRTTAPWLHNNTRKKQHCRSYIQLFSWLIISLLLWFWQDSYGH